jgi:transcriptional regulator with XRE-family HTH domain
MRLDRKQIELALARLSMDQKDFSMKSGISTALISKAAREGSISTKTAGLIAAGLDVPIGKLVKED